MKRLTLALVVSMLAAVAVADSGVLVEHVPGGADPKIVAAVVREALKAHGWDIRAEDATSISATLVDGTTQAQLQLWLVDGRIRYEGAANIPTPGNAAQPRTSRRTIKIPARWLKILQNDISRVLAAQPETPAQ